MSDIKRKLASVREIKEIRPIPGADNIECALIDGWEVVVKKGDFAAGDKCIYYEIDAFLPVREEYEFLRKSSFKSTAHLGDGFRLRTIRLKRQISQGLALPYAGSLDVGEDLTETLGVKKYDKPDYNVNNPLKGGRARGGFPRFIRKTDQERVQNFGAQLARLSRDADFEITLKLDGSSMTVWSNAGDHGVCSRNVNLLERDREPWLQRFRDFGERLGVSADKLNAWEETLDRWKCKLFGGRPGLVKQQSVFWHVARSEGLLDVVRDCGRNIALQGELMGPGIQGNRESFGQPTFFLFDIFDIDAQRYFTPDDRQEFASDWGIQHVPVLGWVPVGALDVPKCLAMANRHSYNHPIAEGIVFKSSDGQTSFKAINTTFLLQEAA